MVHVSTGRVPFGGAGLVQSEESERALRLLYLVVLVVLSEGNEVSFGRCFIGGRPIIKVPQEGQVADYPSRVRRDVRVPGETPGAQELTERVRLVPSFAGLGGHARTQRAVGYRA